VATWYVPDANVHGGTVVATFVSSRSLLPRWLGLCVRYCCDQLVNDLAARLVANAVDLLHLDIGVFLRVLLGLLVA
jgi:hypothetical protein